MIFEDGKAFVFIDGRITVRERSRSNLISDVVKEPVSMRNAVKEDHALDPMERKSTQWASKILPVSIYGALGSTTRTVSASCCAEVVTSLGRIYQTLMKEASKAMDGSMVYGDTDSIFVRLQGWSTEDDMRIAYGDLRSRSA